MDTRHEWEKKAAATRAKIEKLGNEKVFKKQHLTFISNRIYPGFNDFLFMLQYEHKIIIDDSIIESTGDVFIYHIKCSYNKALKLKVFKDSSNAISRLEILGVWYMKQVIYFECYEYYELLNDFIEALEKEDIKVLDIIIGIRILKTGSKVTHTLILDSTCKLTVDVIQEKDTSDIIGISISVNGGDIIEFWKSIQRLL